MNLDGDGRRIIEISKLSQMYLALVYYPRIENQGFQAFRDKYEPYSQLLPEHVPLVHPVPEDIGRDNVERHIKQVLSRWKPFRIHFCKLDKTWDHWLYLGAEEGHGEVMELHDHLYTGILSPYLREDLPFYPHIGVGLFSKETYDFDDPTAELTLDEEKYNKARKEFEKLGMDFWRTIDRLTLLKINDDYTECIDLMEYPFH